jgi:hypothetical protein
MVNGRNAVIRMFRSRERRRQVQAHIAAQDEVEIDPKILEAEGVSHPAELFTDEVKRLMNEKLSSKEIVSQKEVANFLFEEQKLQAQRAQKSGKKSCRYSPVMLRW